jgi:hypothetical protein
MILRKSTLARSIVAILLVAGISPAADHTVWKPIEQALLKIDEKPVKQWTLYREEKDKHAKRFLLQLGARFLLIDTQSKAVEEFRPESFERHGKDLRQSRTGPPAKILATSDWVLREAGLVRIIHVRLNDEGRAVEIQLPSLPDLRY